MHLSDEPGGIMDVTEMLGLPWQNPSPLRSAIQVLHRADEASCVQALLQDGRLSEPEAIAATAAATALVQKLRRKRPGMMAALMREFDLSNPEGLRLMALAEALLRIPDTATADALIRDKLRGGDWRSHRRRGSLFVASAASALDVAARLMGDQAGESAVEHLRDAAVRRIMRHAIGRMGEVFVCGETIEDALRKARRLERENFRFSFDMLGEAAATAKDAARYEAEYRAAIAAIGAASAGRGIHDGPGLSIKLSALHPRYGLHQKERVMRELLPQVTDLFLAARAQNIGIAIDAEETERLGISLDLLEALCCDPRLQGWDGIGFVVQAYQKRAPAVLDWIIDLARRSGHRLMLRLVKGAYWDSEIKRTQVEGLSDYPLFTRKTHTDLSYLACARKLLGAPDAIFPQFATHNAHTLAAIAAIAAMTGPVAAPDRLEFQCLYGMGEPLYRAAFRLGLARSCRIYAPVGGHETLLAYLVRRLLENGANGSFVHRLADRCVAMAELVQEPAATIAAEANPGAAHPAIPKPRALYGTARQNSAGLDLFDDHTLQSIDGYLRHKRVPFVARPPGDRLGPTLSLRNPARLEDIVGHVVQAETGDVEAALSRAEAAAPRWAATTPASRAEILQRAATLMEERLPRLLPLIIREAGKSVPNAVGEVREAVDFLRYYAAETFKPENAGQPLGPFACISPWNFPLAIFTGQVAAALAAGNPVLAKPAEETPLTAMAAVTLLYEAGIPRDVLKTLPGAGDIGAALTADARIRGVAFTGSSSVAKRIQTVLARRLNPGGLPVPFIAETGGLNAMVVDSSALPEQVVADVLSSAFDSAGQRCSALRLLCVQTEIASRLLPMLEGAMAELSLGDPARLSTDIGPVISAEARDMIEAHVNAMRTAGFTVTRPPQRTPPDGFFVPPTLIRLRAVDDLQQEVFGPVLHVLTFDCAELPALIDRINARGFALTAGLHSRIDSVRNFATKRFAAGNIYINRNIIGATVGVQPFGGHGLSGTGPKAGGPLYLRRFQTGLPPLLSEGWRPLPGPAGEENLYGWRPRPAILCAAEDEAALRVQIQATLESGACAVLDTSGTPSGLEGETRVFARGAVAAPAVQAALFSGAATRLTELQQRLARVVDTITPVFIANPDGSYPHEAFITECAVSTNTAASGGAVELLSTRQEA